MLIIRLADEPKPRGTIGMDAITGRRKVLVLGEDMRIFLAVVRSLGRAGHEVHAAPTAKSPALCSRYISATHWLPRYADDPGIWVRAVKTLLETEQFDAVFPNCDDSTLLPFHLHRAEFVGVNIALPNEDSMQVLFDKAATRELCDNLEIPVAPGRVLTRGDTADGLIRSFGLPVIIKPRRSVSLDRVGEFEKVGILESRDALDKALRGLREPEKYLVEGHFAGTGGGVSVLAQAGEILESFQHRRLREATGGVSSYRVSEAVAAPLLEACEKICRRTKFTGVCMFEFRRNQQSGAWILIETNARFWGSLGLPVAVGVDFPADLLNLMVSGSRPARTAYVVGIRSRNLILDGKNVLASAYRSGVAGVPRFLWDLLNYIAHPVFCLVGREVSDSLVADDPMPGLAEFANLGPALARRWKARHGLESKKRELDGHWTAERTKDVMG